MVESIAVDGSQQVRGADDVRVSNVQGVQGFGSRVSNGSGGIAGTVVQNGGAAEDVVSVSLERKGDKSFTTPLAEKPSNWGEMSKTQRRNWLRDRDKKLRSSEESRR